MPNSNVSLISILYFLMCKCTLGFDDADNTISYANLGDYVENKVPSLKNFMRKDIGNQEYNIEPLVALSNAMRSLQR